MKLVAIIAAILAVAGISVGTLSSSSTNPAIDNGASILAPVSSVEIDDGSPEPSPISSCTRSSIRFDD